MRGRPDQAQMRRAWAPHGRVLMPFLGSSASEPWPPGHWDVWAPVFTWALLGRRRPRLWCELHQRRWWRQPKTWRCGYLAWLHRQRARPILMQHRYREVPASVSYPKALIHAAFPGAPPFQGTFDWLMALAVFLGVPEIAVWGVDYDTLHELYYQSRGATYWIGMARGRGLHVWLSPGSSLLETPMSGRGDYGYDYPPWPKGHHPQDWPEAIVPSTRTDPRGR